MKAIKTLNVLFMVAILGCILSCTSDQSVENFETFDLSEKSISLTHDMSERTYQKIGISKKGELKLTDEQSMRESWEADLKIEGFDVELGEFNLVRGDLQNDGSTGYIMMAESLDGSLKIGTSVQLKIIDKPLEISTVENVTLGDGTKVMAICTGPVNCYCDPIVNHTIEDGVESISWDCTTCIIPGLGVCASSAIITPP